MAFVCSLIISGVVSSGCVLECVAGVSRHEGGGNEVAEGGQNVWQFEL